MSETACPTRRWHPPRPIAWLIALGAVVVLLGLGGWQTARLEWKNRLIAEIAEAAAHPPVALPEDEAAIRALAFRRVALRGRFVGETEFHLAARYEAGALGYHVLSPFRLDGSGRIVLLNRGWVPVDRKDAARRPEDGHGEERNIVAMVRTDGDRNPFTPEADPKRNVWFYKDVAGMRRASGLAIEPVPLDVLEDSGLRADLPRPFDGRLTLRNDHLGYALTWFALAIAAGAVFALWHWRREPSGAPAAPRIAYDRSPTPRDPS